MEKKPYEPLEMEIIRFDEEDVLTASGEPTPIDDEGGYT